MPRDPVTVLARKWCDHCEEVGHLSDMHDDRKVSYFACSACIAAAVREALEEQLHTLERNLAMPEMPCAGTPEVGLKGAAEWAERCNREAHAVGALLNSPDVGVVLCISCADAYARQQVEAFRERLMPFVIHRASCPQAGRNYLPDRFFDANIDKCTCGLAAAIRALVP